MRPTALNKWLQENANAPPPPSTPSGLPDDSVSTVYPESSVSNPYASRYTGARHRSITPQPYYERRSTSAQAHRRDRDYYPQYIVPPPTQRHQPFHVESRYAPAPAHPYSYGYQQPAKQMYYTPQTTNEYSRGPHQRSHSTPRYDNYVTSRSPARVEVRSQPARTYATYGNYASTPSIPLQPRAVPAKRPPLLRRLFGIDWGSPKPAPTYSARDSSRSSSKSKSRRSDSKSYNDGYGTMRPRRNSEGIVYFRP